MNNKRMVIFGICAALVLAVSATATTFAAGTTFEPLDWARYDGQRYGSPGAVAAPNTGLGSVDDSSPMRGWLILGLASGAALALAGVSMTLVRNRKE